MQRLTTDKPVNEMNNMELAYNCCIVANGEAVYRDFERTVGARKMIFKLLDYYGVEGFTAETDDELDEYMVDSLMDGPFTMAGMIAIIYRFIWTMAGIRGRLKQYEDTGLDPEKIFEMDRIFAEKCKEVAELKSRISDNKTIEVGTILWQMHGKKRNKEINWYPVSKCVEKIDEHMYLFGDGCGISHNGVGRNMFLSRKECIDDFLKKHKSLVTKSDYDEDLPENCYELPRTDWQDYEVCKFDGVNATSVYLNGLGHLLDVTRQISWRKESCEYRGDIEMLTLTEIYEQFAKEGRSPMITVFVNGPMKCDVFQCGNYEDGKWVHLGKVQGYA